MQIQYVTFIFAVGLAVVLADVTLPLSKASSPLSAVDPNPKDASDLEVMANKLYVVNLGFGTPAQNLNLLVDTAFPNTFVFSQKSLKFADSITGVNAFDPRDSTSYTASGSQTLNYAGKTLTSVKSNDYITAASKLYASNFDFFLSDSGFSTMSSTPSLPFDGVLGLSLSGSANSAVDYFVANANASRSVVVDYSAAKPQITFGSVAFPNGYLSVRIPLGTSSDVDLSGLFFSKLQSLHVGDQLKDYSNFEYDFVVTSNSYSILFPSQIFSDLITAVTAARSDCLLSDNKVKCSRNSLVGLPTLKFKIRGRWFELQSKDYFVNKGAFSGLAFGVSPYSDVRLGVAFLQRYSVAFEYTKPAVSFAYPDLCSARISKPVVFTKSSLSSVLSETLVLPQCSGGSTFTLSVVCPQSSCSEESTIEFPYNFKNASSQCVDSSISGSLTLTNNCTTAQVSMLQVSGENSTCTVELSCPHSNPDPDEPDSPPSEATKEKKRGMSAVAITFLVLGLVLFVVLVIVGGIYARKRYRRNVPKDKTQPLNSDGSKQPIPGTDSPAQQP